MTDEFYTGDWEGHYVYGRTTYKRLGGKLVEFKVELTVKDGVLSGQATEEVTEKYIQRGGRNYDRPEPATRSYTLYRIFRPSVQ